MVQTILVVDDEPSLGHTIASILVSEGYEVDVAYDGMAALRLFREKPTDLVITNTLMPLMSGAQLAIELTRDPNPPSIILTSAMPRPRLLPAEVQFLAKPFDLDQLLKLVRAALG